MFNFRYRHLKLMVSRDRQTGLLIVRSCVCIFLDIISLYIFISRKTSDVDTFLIEEMSAFYSLCHLHSSLYVAHKIVTRTSVCVYLESRMCSSSVDAVLKLFVFLLFVRTKPRILWISIGHFHELNCCIRI